MKAKLFFLLMILCFISLGALIPPEITNMPLPNDPDVITGMLPNGLKYCVMRNAKPEKRIELRLIVDAGSVNEDEDQLGLAHFTEHMAFNGSKNFPRTEMVEYLTSIGMGFHNGLNGGTTYDWTMYMFKLPTEDETKLRKGFSILSDIAWQLSMDSSEIERERGIIMEEWRLGQSAQQRVSDKVDAVRMAGSRYEKRNPIGTIENLKAFQHDSLRRFYHDWYRPDLQTVVMVGDYDPQVMKAMVEEYFGVIPARKDPRPKEEYPVPDNPEPRSIVVLDKELPMTNVQVTWKKHFPKVTDLGTYYEDLKRQLFYAMFNARMEELMLRPDPPFGYAWGYSADWLKNFSASTLGAICSEGKSEEALQALLQEISRIKQHGYLPAELDRAKQELIRSAEKAVAEKPTRDSEELIWELVFPMLQNTNILSPEQHESFIKGMLAEIGIEEVNAIVDDMISSDNLTISLSGTDKEGAVYPTKERMLGIYNDVKNQELEAWVDNTINEPILENIPKPGKIAKEKVFKASGIKQWTLSNGITVYSKQTDFKADEVLLWAGSPGGRAVLSPEIAKAADIIPLYVQSSGFGKFDGTALQKALAGKVAQVNMFVDTYREGLRGSCSPKDMELMFQMLYQYIKAPRFDEATFNTAVTRTRSFIQNAELDPENAFFDSLTAYTNNHHPLKSSLKAEDLDKMTFSQMQQVYMDRFGDFTDFSFYIVGAFDEALLKDYCTTYLANLPANKRIEKIKDVGIKTFAGSKQVRFQKGESDRAFASNVTAGTFSYSFENKTAINAMLHISDEKLRENVRENLSGVYAIAIWPELIRYPQPEFTVTTWMGCDPEKVDMLSEATFATLDSLKNGLFDDKYMAAAKTTLLSNYEQDIKTNRYWMARMSDNVFNKQPIDDFLDFHQYIKRLDKKAIVKAANQYLTFDKKKLSVIMLPQK